MGSLTLMQLGISGNHTESFENSSGLDAESFRSDPVAVPCPLPDRTRSENTSAAELPWLRFNAFSVVAGACLLCLGLCSCPSLA